VSHRIPSSDKNVCANARKITTINQSFFPLIYLDFSPYYYNTMIIIYREVVYTHTPILISEQIDRIILAFVRIHHLRSFFFLYKCLPVSHMYAYVQYYKYPQREKCHCYYRQCQLLTTFASYSTASILD
jgi:hypothetical protein